MDHQPGPGDLVGKGTFLDPVGGREICAGLNHSDTIVMCLVVPTVIQGTHKIHPAAAQSLDTRPSFRNHPPATHGQNPGFPGQILHSSNSQWVWW